MTTTGHRLRGWGWLAEKALASFAWAAGVLLAAASVSPAAHALEGEIAFVRLTAGYWQIWRLDLPSGRQIQLTDSSFDKRYPAWDDAGGLYFRSNNDEFYRLASGTVHEEPFLPEVWPAIDLIPGPEDAGFALAKLRTDVNDANSIYRVSGPGQPQRMLSSGPGFRRHLDWSSDGRYIAFMRSRRLEGSDIRRIPAQGGPVEDVVTGEFHSLHPAHAPTGDALAYAANRSGDYEIWLHEWRGEGGSDRRLTHSPGLDSKPTWSPDGRQIAFETYRAGRFEIWVMARDGSDPRSLIAGNADARDPAWR